MPLNNKLLVNGLDFKRTVKTVRFRDSCEQYRSILMPTTRTFKKFLSGKYGNTWYKYPITSGKAFNMIKFSKFDKRTKNKVSKRIRKNLATHPFVVVAIIAAISVTIWAIAFFIFRF